MYIYALIFSYGEMIKENVCLGIKSVSNWCHMRLWIKSGLLMVLFLTFFLYVWSEIWADFCTTGMFKVLFHSILNHGPPFWYYNTVDEVGIKICVNKKSKIYFLNIEPPYQKWFRFPWCTIWYIFIAFFWDWVKSTFFGLHIPKPFSISYQPYV